MIHESINLTVLSDQLHRGNAGVPEWCRHAFYGAKSFLLSAFGTPDGRDIQRIDYDCYSCNNGTRHNYRHGRLYDTEPCWRCHGTGIHHSRTTWLDRFRFGSHCFHVPVDGVTFYADSKPTIVGRIEHKSYTDSAQCAIDISWLFNRDALRRAVEWHTQMYGGFARAEGLDGPGAEFCRKVARDKVAENAREWKRIIEEKVDHCPF